MNTRILTPDDQIVATARRQYAAFSHAQAISAGLTDTQIGDRLAVRRWQSPTRGVYIIAGSTDSWQQRATVAYLATKSAGGGLSHVTGCGVFGLLPASPLPHVIVPPGRSPRCRVAKVHRAAVPAQDWQLRGPWRVTTPSRLLVDMAAFLGGSALEELTDSVLCQQLASVGSVLASMDRAGPRRHGYALLREVLRVWTPTIEPGSVAEVRLLRWLADLGVTDAVTQYEVYV